MKYLKTLYVITTSVIGFLLISQLVFADEPQISPSTKTVWSLNKKFYALMDPGMNITTIYQVLDKDKKNELWSMFGWFRVAGLSSDGQHHVTGHNGMNLLPVNHKKDEVMLYIFKKGELINYVTLDQLIKDPSKLQKTVSHIYWGNFVGIDDNDHYVVESVENRQIVYDITIERKLKTN